MRENLDDWPKILIDLSQLFGGNCCTLALSGAVAATGPGVTSTDAEPWLTVLADLAPGAVTTMRLTQNSHTDLEALVGSAGPGVGLMIEAPPGARFSPADSTTLRGLLSLLASAVHASSTLQSGALAVLDQLAFGILVLDADGAVGIANSRAQGLLAAAGLGVETGTLRGRTAASTELLLNRIALAADGACHAEWLPQAGGYAALQLAFWPLRPGQAMALLTAPAAAALTNPLPLQSLLGLTRAQARLTALLADGFSLRDAAARLGITHGSAITQLKNVYARTGVGSQSALVRLVLTGPSALIAAAAVAAILDSP